MNSISKLKLISLIGLYNELTGLWMSIYPQAYSTQGFFARLLVINYFSQEIDRRGGISPLWHSISTDLEASYKVLKTKVGFNALTWKNKEVASVGKGCRIIRQLFGLPNGNAFWWFSLLCFLQCFNASKLLTSHGMGIQVLLNATEFNYLCPAIINQIDARSCLIHTTSEKKAEIPPKTYSLQIGRVAFLM